MNRTELNRCVEKAKRKDAKAIEALYQYTYPKMHALVAHLCVSGNDVEDILQEGYVSAFSNLHQLENDAAFTGWLRKTVVNAWRMHVRENIPAYDTTVLDVAEEALEDWQLGASTQDVVELAETSREIWELIQALPEPQRVCMVLFYYDNMKIDEIAESLSIPEGSVKSRLYYGRQKLKEAMEKRGIHAVAPLTAPAIESVAGEAMLAKILAAVGTASGGTAAAAAGGGLAAKVALTVAALATAGGIAGGIALRPRPKLPAQIPTATTRATVTTTTVTAATTTTTTTAATTTTTAATTTTAPKPVATFDYQTAEGGVVLTKHTSDEPDVIIPESVDGMPVVAIGADAFRGSDVPESVTIPSTVRTVGSHAFSECRRLRRVSLGGGVKTVGDGAFLGCSSLERVNIPASVREIGIYAFAYCHSLTEVEVAEGTALIGYAAFRDCPNLRQATLPASVTSIGGDSFDGASPEFTIIAPEGSYAAEYFLMRNA